MSNTEKKNEDKQTRIRNGVMIAVMTAVICVLGPLSIPIGPVPISLTNLAIYITLYVLGMKRGTLAYCLYLLIGLVGVPVFSGFTGGPGKLFGPTGGYLLGFIPMAIVAGLVIDRFPKKPVLCVIAMFGATWICYITGTLWLSYSAHMDLAAAFAAGVTPFIIEDLCKMIGAAIIGPVLQSALRRAGLLQPEVKNA